MVRDCVINNSIFDHDSNYYAKVSEDISLKFQDQQVEVQNMSYKSWILNPLFMFWNSVYYATFGVGLGKC